MPKCHTSKMMFAKTNPEKPVEGFRGYDTSVNKKGTECSVDDLKL